MTLVSSLKDECFWLLKLIFGIFLETVFFQSILTSELIRDCPPSPLLGPLIVLMSEKKLYNINLNEKDCVKEQFEPV